MDLHMQSHRWEARLPDWAAAAVAGFGAGGILMVCELVWSVLILGSDPWGTLRMIAAMVMGSQVLAVGGYSLAVVVAGLAVHFVLGISFAIAMAMLFAPLRLDSSVRMALAAGALFGAVLYLFNFYVMDGAYPWFSQLRGWSTAVGHVIFGMTAAFAYLKLERRAP